jgi:hypothetical protein
MEVFRQNCALLFECWLANTSGNSPFEAEDNLNNIKKSVLPHRIHSVPITKIFWLTLLKETVAVNED